MAKSDPRLYLFSSDYPHTEGGRQPLGRFEASLQGAVESEKAHFYSGNFARLLRSPETARLAPQRARALENKALASILSAPRTARPRPESDIQRGGPS